MVCSLDRNSGITVPIFPSDLNGLTTYGSAFQAVAALAPSGSTKENAGIYVVAGEVDVKLNPSLGEMQM